MNIAAQLITCASRLDMTHHAVSLMLDGALHVVQLPEKLDRILDVGRGTGIWAIDMAEFVPCFRIDRFDYL